MKITKKQLKRIIKETIQNSRIIGIENLIYDGEYSLADANLRSLGQSLQFLRIQNPEKAQRLEKEYDRLLALLDRKKGY